MTKIYHNPRCGTSRNVLQALQDRGLQPEIIEYLKTPPSRAQIEQLIGDAGLGVRDAMRSKEAVYQELKLDDTSLSDAQLLDAIAEHPILLNRPFVITAKGTRLCRPADVVEEIL
ncbi:arsenate reductase (glutaredoxin) [Allopusillimonas ginsengisoli]|uniref:arsenate reductase (glutaredoxin) n=1 Tax=Allopusillimonas ginsengisoli TaxID=453575 RepID=UPI00101FF12E|nr:arsenate reductase (glutaredoxin) [Allopusillimonas ginsengisoli]TEA77611.1 arsenate reductase (glutaredoxin) [Allopusillimonas ginsengisoli]